MPWASKYKPQQIRPEGIVRVTGMRSTSPSQQQLCGQVMNVPGQHGDWICRQMAVKTDPDGLCRLHKARSSSSAFQEDGKRAQLLDELHLTDEFKGFREDPELTELRHELALTDTLMSKLFKKAMKVQSKENLHEYREIVKLRKQLVDSVHKNTTAVVPRDRVVSFMYAIATIACKYVKDPREKAAMLADIRAISGRHTEQLKITDAVDVESTVEPTETEVVD